MFWPMLVLVAVALAAALGMAPHAARARTSPVHGATRLHRAGVGRHRIGGSLSVARLRAREYVDRLPVDLDGRGTRS